MIADNATTVTCELYIRSFGSINTETMVSELIYNIIYLIKFLDFVLESA